MSAFTGKITGIERDNMKVTIGALTEDLVPFTEKGNLVADVAIVPRRIVEDIINTCNDAVTVEANCMKDYAEKGERELFERAMGRKTAYYAISNIAEAFLNRFERSDEE